MPTCWLGIVAGIALSFFTEVLHAGVLSERDVRGVEGIRQQFQSLMIDLSESAKRPDIAAGDADCIKAVMQDMLQISGELRSYEYLITIEKEVPDSGEGSPVPGLIKFAVDSSTTILGNERKRLLALLDQCKRYPLSSGKAQQALQFIEQTTGILSSIAIKR